MGKLLCSFRLTSYFLFICKCMLIVVVIARKRDINDINSKLRSKPDNEAFRRRLMITEQKTTLLFLPLASCQSFPNSLIPNPDHKPHHR